MQLPSLRDLEMVELQTKITKLTEDNNGLTACNNRLKLEKVRAQETILRIQNDFHTLHVESWKKDKELEGAGLTSGHRRTELYDQKLDEWHSPMELVRVQELYDILLSSMDLARDSRVIVATISPDQIRNKFEHCQYGLAVLNSGYMFPIDVVDTSLLFPGFFTFLNKLFGRSKSIPIHDPSEALVSVGPLNLRSVLKAYAMDSLCERIFLQSNFHDFDKSRCKILERYRVLIGATTGTEPSLQLTEFNNY